MEFDNDTQQALIQLANYYQEWKTLGNLSELKCEFAINKDNIKHKFTIVINKTEEEIK